MTRAPATSFIVRVWEDTESSSVRGEIEHIGTGEKRLFVDYSSMLSVMDTWRHDQRQSV